MTTDHYSLKRSRTIFEPLGPSHTSSHNEMPHKQLKLQMPNRLKINGITQYRFASTGQSITTQDAPYIPVFFKNSNKNFIEIFCFLCLHWLIFI